MLFGKALLLFCQSDTRHMQPAHGETALVKTFPWVSSKLSTHFICIEVVPEDFPIHVGPYSNRRGFGTNCSSDCGTVLAAGQTSYGSVSLADQVGVRDSLLARTSFSALVDGEMRERLRASGAGSKIKVTNFFDTVSSRHSIRAFKSQQVEREKIERILETANCAPSAGDLQAYQIYLVHDLDSRLRLAYAAFDQMFISEAPVVLVFCAVPARSAAKYGRRGQQLYALQDATIACAYAQLAVAALGLGATWVGAFDEDAVRRAIGISRSEKPIAILPIGHPAEAPSPTPRRRLANLVREV